MSLAGKGVRCIRAGRVLLDDVSLSVAPGSVHALLGPNGAGKTTLLHALAGAIAIDGGSVQLDGTPLNRQPAQALARRRAVLAQADSLSFPYTVDEVVTLGRLPFEPEAAAEERRIVAAALTTAGVSQLAQRRYGDLSGGERTRVRLARALTQVWEQFETAPGTGGARYLLLDEPAAHLDPAHQHLVLQVMRRFADAGGGALVTLHDPNLALAYADTVTLLKAGQIQTCGPVNSTLTAANLEQLYEVRMQRIEQGSDGIALISRPRG